MMSGFGSCAKGTRGRQRSSADHRGELLNRLDNDLQMLGRGAATASDDIDSEAYNKVFQMRSQFLRSEAINRATARAGFG